MSHLRFSLRAGLVAVTLTCILAALLANSILAIRREAAHARELDRVIRMVDDGLCSVDTCRPNSLLRQALYRLAGSPGEVYSVRVFRDPSFEALIAHGKYFSRLRDLEVICPVAVQSPDAPAASAPAIGRRHLEAIGEFRSLRKLQISGPFDDDVSLRPLGKLSHLFELDLEIKSRRVPRGLTDGLDNLPALGALNIYIPDLNIYIPELEADVPSHLFECFPRLRALQFLNLGFEINDEIFEHISRAPKLRDLAVGGSSLTDDGGGRACVRLHVVWLCLTAEENVTDASIDSLASIKELHDLKVDKNQFSPAGLARLRSLRPDIAITH
jgi:hypothetical protein